MEIDVKITNAATDRIKYLIEKENNNDLKLRISVVGGGCSGFQYKFDFDEFQNDDDFVLEKNDVIILIDSMSYQYLIGAEIDFKEDLYGSAFELKNPNAKSTCGCNSSFSV